MSLTRDPLVARVSYCSRGEAGHFCVGGNKFRGLWQHFSPW